LTPLVPPIPCSGPHQPTRRLCSLAIRRAIGAGTPQVHQQSTAGTWPASPGPVPGEAQELLITLEGDDGVEERGLSGMMAAEPRPYCELDVSCPRSLMGAAARTR